MADKHTGKCFCGAVEIEATGAPAAMGSRCTAASEHLPAKA